MHQTKFFNLLKLFFNVAISTSFGNFGIPELKPSTPLFSYQYLSPSFRSLNCCPMMQENKAPTLAPSCGISAIPPAYTSISSTSLQVNVLNTLTCFQGFFGKVYLRFKLTQNFCKGEVDYIKSQIGMNTQNYIIHDCINNVKNNLEQYVHIERYKKK